ncbi:hypothetical protein SDC9_20320 [bioreactor metagenome]|uniref:Uncharacterized protein n=1 Tax=bioreactor metagenome TaxID=1076179 RepID=A0A644U6D4_9ZZZZ
MTFAAFTVMQRDDPFTFSAGPFCPFGRKKCGKSLIPDENAVFDQTFAVSVLISLIHIFYQFTGEIFAGKTVTDAFLPEAGKYPAVFGVTGFPVRIHEASAAGFFRQTVPAADHTVHPAGSKHSYWNSVRHSHVPHTAQDNTIFQKIDKTTAWSLGPA